MENPRLCKICGLFKEYEHFRPSGPKKKKRICKDCRYSDKGVFSNLDQYEIISYEKFFLQTGEAPFDTKNVDHTVNQVCLKCGEIKLYEEFRYRAGKKKGNRYFSHHCKKCEALYTSQWRELNPEKAKEYHTEYIGSGRAREAHVKFAINNLQRFLFNRAKHNAKNKNVPFDLSIEDIEIPEVCPYLGVPFVLGIEKSHSRTENGSTYSIDRIIPEKGYVKGNIRIISWKANTMKNSASIEELVTFAKNVLLIHGES